MVVDQVEGYLSPLEFEWRGLPYNHQRSKKKRTPAGILSGYGISDDYERYMHDDDEDGSRTIPSRTKLGKVASTLEKFPFLGNPLVLFGGLITVPFWGYRNTPLALIDLMLSDMPRVEYGKEKLTKRDFDETKVRQAKMEERIKKQGGLGINFAKQIDTNTFMQKLKGD